jgi:hypothetical protein
MHRGYLAFFEDVDRLLEGKSGNARITLRVIGFVALHLAGLPDRGTKDVDMLMTSRIEAMSESSLKEIFNFLKDGFGKGSAGAVRHGMYLDIVSESVPWLPPKPQFIPAQKLQNIEIVRLHPTDVCVSKAFSNFKSKKDRAQDRNDILDALDNRIIAFDDYVRRLDDTLPHYETHAEAPEVFPQVMQFINELQEEYGPCALSYDLPSWMENM